MQHLGADFTILVAFAVRLGQASRLTRNGITARPIVCRACGHAATWGKYDDERKARREE